MEDSWTKLDGDSVEKEVMTVFKVMTKTSKVLANRDLPACSENCLSIKEEVRLCTLNPTLHYPLAHVCLRGHRSSVIHPAELDKYTSLCGV